MNQTTLERFAEDLHGHGGPPLTSVRLDEVKRRGARRRRRRLAGVAVATVVVLGGSVSLVLPGGPFGSAPDRAIEPVSRPHGLSSLQKRVLREVPGATRLSVWQVAVPEPADATNDLASIVVSTDDSRSDFTLEGDTHPTGVTSYAGVTAYERAAFPGWLWDAVTVLEVAATTTDGGRPVGSTDMGISVANGSLELACVSFEGADCAPAVIRNQDGDLFYEWGFGTERFLDRWRGMEVFAGNPSPADAPSLAVAGLGDDAVESVDFVNTDGEVVEGSVDHEMSPGSTIMWAEVPGALARIVAYDASGAVVDDHRLRSCSGGVDCEVR